MFNWWLIKWLQDIEHRKEYKGLPRGCWHCELLGICRRSKEEDWRCLQGCQIIKAKNKKSK